MAYGIKYISWFKNRIQNDSYLIAIWEKDYGGDYTEIKSGETAFSINWPTGDTDILTPIKSSEATFSILTDGSLTIEDFYSDDDEKFLVELYLGESPRLYSGYLVQDGTSEQLTDQKHYLTFKVTDNLGLLKNSTWGNTSDTPETMVPLGTYIREALQETGLYSHNTTIDRSLPLRIYDNLFETTIDDRNDSDTADPFQQITLDPAMFLSDDGNWTDLYEILEKILGAKNADIIQANGYWNVRRIPEYRLFTDGEIPGTQYIFNGSEEDATAVTLSPIVTIARNGQQVAPILEDQIKSLQRSVRYVKNTFNYDQPVFIRQQNLQIDPDAVPFDTNTIGDFRYDDYDIPTYFTDWFQRGTVDSYLEVVTNIATDPETEEDRYIVIKGDDALDGGVQFNAFPVSANDKFDFSVRWRTDTDTDDLIRFWVRFVLITADNHNYNLQDNAGTGNDEFRWVGPSVSADLWDTGSGIYHEFTNPDNIDTTQWMDWNLSDSQFSEQEIPPIPKDGMLLIEVRGTDSGSETDRQNVYFKDITLDFKNYINTSLKIIGQTHKVDGPSTNKAVQENEIYNDDSPRNTISGTLFTDDLTNFEYTDTNTGEATGIGDVYFTKTRLWHRADIIETLRLGNITTDERLQLQYKTRLVIEGTFKNLRYDTDKFISPLTLFQFDFITGKYFIPASMEIDYMACTFKTRLVEIFSDDHTESVVFMAGTKNEQLSVFTQNIEFDTITYFGGADTYITPSLSNSRFTYSGPDTTIDLSVIFFVPISGSGTATFTLLKNGSVIDTQTVNATEHFKRIDFLETGLAVTNGDYFESAVDPGTADVDIQSGSINITINDVIAPYPYHFNYIYDTAK